MLPYERNLLKKASHIFDVSSFNHGRNSDQKKEFPGVDDHELYQDQHHFKLTI